LGGIVWTQEGLTESQRGKNFGDRTIKDGGGAGERGRSRCGAIARRMRRLVPLVIKERLPSIGNGVPTRAGNRC